MILSIYLSDSIKQTGLLELGINLSKQSKHAGARYLVLYGSEEYNSIYNRIRYLINVISGIIYIYNFSKIIQKSK